MCCITSALKIPINIQQYRVMVSASVFLAFHFVPFLIYLWRDISVMRGYKLHTVLHNIGMCTILEIRIQWVHKSTFVCPLVLCYTQVPTHYLLCSRSSQLFLLHITCLLQGRGSFQLQHWCLILTTDYTTTYMNYTYGFTYIHCQTQCQEWPSALIYNVGLVYLTNYKRIGGNSHSQPIITDMSKLI
jgi:hypothetical protein